MTYSSREERGSLICYRSAIAPLLRKTLIAATYLKNSKPSKTFDMSDISALAPDCRHLGKGGRAGFEAIRKNCLANGGKGDVFLVKSMI